MPKYRIVQVKPEGLADAFQVEEQVVKPGHKKVSKGYESQQAYYEQRNRFNVGGYPSDYWERVPESTEWKFIASYDLLFDAEQGVYGLKRSKELLEAAKVFKSIVVQEYD